MAVHFDFTGSLDLARDLWTLADELETMTRRRSDAADSASTDWSGPFGDIFRRRVENELEDFSDLTLRLRSAADSWAEAWATATDEKNRQDHAAAVEAERDSRGFGERAFDVVLGDDSADVVGPPPAPVRVPVSPRFGPTS